MKRRKKLGPLALIYSQSVLYICVICVRGATTIRWVPFCPLSSTYYAYAIRSPTVPPSIRPLFLSLLSGYRLLVVLTYLKTVCYPNPRQASGKGLLGPFNFPNYPLIDQSCTVISLILQLLPLVYKRSVSAPH
jgi:hypothetical protein